MDLIIVIGIFVLVTSVLISIFVIVRIRKKGLFTQKAPKVPLKGDGEVNGHPYNWQRSGPAQNKNPFFKLSVSCPHEGRFTLRRENAFDRFFKRIGLVEEISCFNEEFDTAHFVSSSHPEFCSQLFFRSDVKSVVSRIFSRGFTHLRLKRKGLEAAWIPYRPKDHAIGEQELSKLAKDLVALVKNIESIPLSDQDRLQKNSWHRKLTGLYLFLGLCGIVSIAGLSLGLRSYPPLDPGFLFLSTLKWSLPSLLLTLFFIFKLLKGNASAHSHFLGLSALALGSFLLLAFGGGAFLNGYLDQSPTQPHSVLVVDKYYTKSKNNYTYHLKLESWRKEQPYEDQTVSRSFYEQISPNESRLEMVTRAGHYQFEWLVSYRFENPY